MPRLYTPDLGAKSLIPRPESVTPGHGLFELTADTRIVADGDAEVARVADLLAERLRKATGRPLPVGAGPAAAGAIVLRIDATAPPSGDEGYVLQVAPEGVTLTARTPAGLFHGTQTIRQLLPPVVEAETPRPGPWTMPCVSITDAPRFAWRGAMLDVARHFFSVADVERFVDLLAFYKMNRLHLHLSDDQGWRIAIAGWPKLAAVGGTTQVGGVTGAFSYSKDDYAAIVRYAAERYVTVVPEIDMPGHTNAALSAYAELNCDGVARAPYTGIEVGFSSFCLEDPKTLSFVGDVIREIAAMTPGAYVHVGGDEAKSTDPAEYVRFVEEVQTVVASHGKQTVGWEEIAGARLRPDSLVQQWDRGLARKAVTQGNKIIFSPSKRAYLDMKYDRGTALGQDWAAHIEVQDAYDWDPASYDAGVPEASVAGVEAPLWTETITSRADIEYMVLPRLAGIAEIGWSPRAGRAWDEYRVRLGVHGLRLTAMGANFYRSPQVPWM